ncbi:hypothetical protein CPB84DRAFT_488362 [Gymnopilus junonius]|uniref:Uncharacterized protein n=1 Tax=Gymnopilus junonius TaxID=109634 RepID=A0A9P5NXP7_GYMJU|nr:hypothetical protein CPB84DRAFT_488362 [Gymnopilus junonius]
MQRTVIGWANQNKLQLSLVMPPPDGDRSVYCWSIQDTSSNEKPIASITLDSDVKSISLSLTSQLPQTLVTLSVSGKLSFVPIPSEILVSTGGKSGKIQSFLPRSSVSSASSKAHPSAPPIIDLIPLPEQPGTIRVVRLVKGIQPVFDIVRYLDDSNTFIEKPILNEILEVIPDDGLPIVPNKRYAESSSLTVTSGMDIDRNEDFAVEDEAEGTLQVDLAELSLGLLGARNPRNKSHLTLPPFPQILLLER